MSIAARLTELGIELPAVAAPLAAYIPANVSGDWVFTSGQLPLVDGQLPATGKLGAEVAAEQGAELARQCALNAIAAAADAVGSVDRLTGVVKVTGFVASDPSFTGQPAVINGASNVLGEIFGGSGKHARSAVGVSVLPIDAPVEVEVIFSFA